MTGVDYSAGHGFLTALGAGRRICAPIPRELGRKLVSLVICCTMPAKAPCDAMPCMRPPSSRRRAGRDCLPKSAWLAGRRASC